MGDSWLNDLIIGESWESSGAGRREHWLIDSRTSSGGPTGPTFVL